MDWLNTIINTLRVAFLLWTFACGPKQKPERKIAKSVWSINWQQVRGFPLRLSSKPNLSCIMITIDLWRRILNLSCVMTASEQNFQLRSNLKPSATIVWRLDITLVIVKLLDHSPLDEETILFWFVRRINFVWQQLENLFTKTEIVFPWLLHCAFFASAIF